MKPYIEKKTLYENDSSVELVSGESFFKFFEKKRLKLILAWGSGFVGIVGNFYAVRYQITKTRFDMLGSDDVIDLYAFGLTALLDLMIVVFHLMRIPYLTWGSTISAVVISIYANMALMIESQSVSQLKSESASNLQFGGSMIVGLIMSALPILILTYLMHLVMNQYDKEMKIATLDRYNKTDMYSSINLSEG